jgi:hypothetical protein
MLIWAVRLCDGGEIQVEDNVEVEHEQGQGPSTSEG